MQPLKYISSTFLTVWLEFSPPDALSHESDQPLCVPFCQLVSRIKFVETILVSDHQFGKCVML